MLKLFTSIFFLLILAGCAGTPGGPIAGNGGALVDDGSAGAAAVAPVYRLAAGDEVRVTVFGEPELSGEFQVGGTGGVAMPLIGEVEAAGRTLEEFRDAVDAALRDGYLNDPRVTAEVLNFRPIFVLGEVESSGEYPYSDGMTVLNAVARAGGFTYRANTRIVFIKRAGAANEVQAPLTADLRVMPGDTIRIGERFF